MKKSKKVFLFVLAFVFVIVCVFLFINRKPNRPNTNLEFWIGDNVDEVDFSDYIIKPGLFGGREYYGSDYVPTFDEDGRTFDSAHCVVYTVTAYPDYSSNKQHITGITITDPAVEFYGISLNSSHKEFEELIKKHGFKITDTDYNHHTAERGKYSVIFSKDCIRIKVKVRNFFGIQF